MYIAYNIYQIRKKNIKFKFFQQGFFILVLELSKLFFSKVI